MIPIDHCEECGAAIFSSDPCLVRDNRLLCAPCHSNPPCGPRQALADCDEEPRRIYGGTIYVVPTRAGTVLVVGAQRR